MKADSIKSISKFYKLSVEQRLEALRGKLLLDSEEIQLLHHSIHSFGEKTIDKMIENVIGVMSLPLGLAMHLNVNHKEYIVPMAIEEPSVVAALSNASKTISLSGGFTASLQESFAIGQIHFASKKTLQQIKSIIDLNKNKLIDHGNSFHPNMISRGGGIIDFEVLMLEKSDKNLFAIHVIVETKDAMGANLVNSICEGIAPMIEELISEEVILRIISNFNDRSMVEVTCKILPENIHSDPNVAEKIINGFVQASLIAQKDVYRAVTHNKGIMNGIDPIAIATANDWRAIEAGIHAYASRSGEYRGVSEWYRNEDGILEGAMRIPLKVGTAGAQQRNNKLAQLSLKLLDVKSSSELAQLMAAAGLAQNFSAIKALVSEGIQTGHMALHARSIVSSIGVPSDLFDEVLNELVSTSDINTSKAQEIFSRKQTKHKNIEHYDAYAHGKIILTGEHAVVYHRHAVAMPIPLKISCLIEEHTSDRRILIPAWNVNYQIKSNPDSSDSMEHAAYDILSKLGLDKEKFIIHVQTDLIRGGGLGSSAALSLAIIEALDQHFRLDLNIEDKNHLAYLSEVRAHGNPSGIDNTVINHNRPILFKRGETNFVEPLNFKNELFFLVAISPKSEFTVKRVSEVAKMFEKNPKNINAIFDQINQLSLDAVKAINEADIDNLGAIMNINHGLLNALGVSTPDIENLLQEGKDRGAIGGKVSGAGGGGALIFLMPDLTTSENLKNHFQSKSIQTFTFSYDNASK